MKTRFLVSLLTALMLIIMVPTGGNAVGLGKTCGGFPGTPCDAGLFCQQKPGTCKIIDMTGTCVKVPQICTREIRKVCGCNKVTYNNDCERKQAMVSLLHIGACKY